MEDPKLANTGIDYLTSLAKGGVGMVQLLVGSLMAEIIGNVIPNQRADRLASFLSALNNRIAKLEDEFLKTRLREPAVVDLLEDAFFQAARATSQGRIEHIAAIVANGISVEQLNETETKRMLWLLGQLNDVEVLMLRGRLALTNEDYEADKEFQEKHAHVIHGPHTHSGSSVDEFERDALHQSQRRHLVDLGLIKYRFARPRRNELPEFDERTGMMKVSGSEVTRLGRMLLRYLDLMPTWYHFG